MNASALRNKRHIIGRTPEMVGIKKGLRIPPKGGWKPRTYYVVDVAFSSLNPIHRAIFYSGFIKDNNPSGYSRFIYCGDSFCRDIYYLKALKEIDINFNMDVDADA